MTIAVGVSAIAGILGQNAGSTAGINTQATGSSFYVIVTLTANNSVTISDNKGNSGNYVQIGSTIAAGSRWVQRWLCFNGAGGSGHTFTATQGASATNNFGIAAVEITGGVVSVSPLDLSSTATGSFVSSLNTGNVVLGSVGGAGELLLTGFSTETFSAGLTFGCAGYTIQQSIAVTNTGAPGMAVASNVVLSNGTYSATWSDGGSQNYIDYIDSFTGLLSLTQINGYSPGGAGLGVAQLTSGAVLVANFADRVQETTTTSGTGTLTLGGAVTAFQSFASAFPTLTQVAYSLLDGNQWEVGYGTFTTGFLSRDYVIQSSNANALVNLSGGSTLVACTGLAQGFDWPTFATRVAAADILVIPPNRQLMMSSDLNMVGSIIALGDIAIL